MYILPEIYSVPVTDSLTLQFLQLFGVKLITVILMQLSMVNKLQRYNVTLVRDIADRKVSIILNNKEKSPS